MAHGKKKTPQSKELVKQKLRERKKLSKQNLKEKKARLIVKNLPFKSTEENLKEYFEKYGEVANVDILKKPDGKLVGCGFIQFKLVQKAAKARHHTNGKDFLGRPLTVDFAKSKDDFKKEQKKKADEIKEEVIDVDEIKEEPIDVDEIKEDSKAEIVPNKESNSDDESEDEGNSENEVIESTEERKPYVSNDVTEGKTIFVKNIPFQATKNDLRQCMLQYGPVYYALICVDKLTEHSKGTAFVKFVNKEDAEKALNAGTELTLMGNVLDCHAALGRNEVQKKVQDQKDVKKEPKDSRNLYLVKEGVILAGTKAAEGVSASDMAKRLQIEQYKTQMLRNLNMFVSNTRLVVHNLPTTWDDQKLRTLCQKYSGEGAVIREARIMRDMKILDANGVGKSKEYGFVSFTKPENALAALRNLNNNPDIFSATKRPILAFSIENKSMIKARVKRLEKSRQNNPTFKGFAPQANREQKKFTKLSRKRKYDGNADTGQDTLDDPQEFSGVAAKPGTKQKMRSKYKLTTQAKLHYENLKKEKKKKKNAKKTLAEKKQDFIRQPKQKINKSKTVTDNFSKLVSEYKSKLSNAPSTKKSKWYE